MEKEHQRKTYHTQKVGECELTKHKNLYFTQNMSLIYQSRMKYIRSHYCRWKNNPID